MNPFEELETHYPEIIDGMPKRFNSHEFILKLAHRYQSLYIKALAECVDHENPFQTVHGQIANRLRKFPELVEAIDQENSQDIFGHANAAVVWRKK